MDALLIIDLQNDFCPGGALEVPNGDAIVPPINTLVAAFDTVLQTQDWHPADHSSFASNHHNKSPYDTVEMPYGEQVLWPDHCVQNSPGSQFQSDLNTQKTQIIIRKGFRPDIDSYSAFYENDSHTPTGLTGYLHQRGIDHLYVTGLATDFCVKWSVLDGLNEGFKITVVEDAVKGIGMEDSISKAWNEMQLAGADTITSSELIANR